jgi:hypothetical protein
MPPDSPSNGSGPAPGEVPPGLKTPAPHDRPSLAAQMAEADAQRAAAANAALHDQIAHMLEDDPATLLMNLPALFGQALIEIVAAGVQAGIQRAAQAQAAPADVAARKPILLAQTGNVRMAAQAAMTGMPPPVPPGTAG